MRKKPPQKAAQQLVWLMIMASLFSFCKKDKDSPSVEENKKSIPIFPIGVAVSIEPFQTSEKYKRIIYTEFTSITAENAFKAENLHPLQDEYNWTDADMLVNYCKANQKRLHGHTLIWHNQLPIWISDYTGTQEQWELLFKNHIQTIVSHFKGNIAGWDVVNEAFNEDGTLRNSIWKQHVGEDYIEKAFIYAKQADSNALLFYNDYNLEFNLAKRDSVISYFNRLKLKGVKVDGIGLQMHIGILFPSASQISEAINKVVNNNYMLHLSELDISVNQRSEDIEPSEALFSAQAQLLENVITAYRQIPNQYQYGITVWGVTDKYTWIRSFFSREDYPLLYDDNYNPKPAYFSFKRLTSAPS
jgi:endo-1,4-beta-xylanase